MPAFRDMHLASILDHRLTAWFVGPSSVALVIRLGHIPKHYTSDCNIPFSVSRESPTNTVRPSRCNLIIFRAHAKNDLDFDPVFVLPDYHW